MPFWGCRSWESEAWSLWWFAMMAGANISGSVPSFRDHVSDRIQVAERYRQEGLAGLVERSRRPRPVPRQNASAIEAKVLAVREASNNAWAGARSGNAREPGRDRDPGGEHESPRSCAVRRA